MSQSRTSTPAERVLDIKQFFTDPDHWVYKSKGTPSNIRPQSIYHLTQLQVLFEDKCFHALTYVAVSQLRSEGFLQGREEYTNNGTKVNVIYRTRYPERAIRAHIELVNAYSSPSVSKATGDHSELLVEFGLVKLGFSIVSRNSNAYQGLTWTTTGHDLDFIIEKDGVGYGVEVKNTFDYMPNDELDAKLRMCSYLGLHPFFVVRNRDVTQRRKVQAAGGEIYMYKSKISPFGFEELANEIWREMRLPVAVRRELPTTFQATLQRLTQAQQ